MQRSAVTAHSTANDRQIIVKLLSSLCQDSRQSTSPLCPSRTEPASSASAWCTVLEVQQQEGQEGVACNRSLLSVVKGINYGGVVRDRLPQDSLMVSEFLSLPSTHLRDRRAAPPCALQL